MNEQPPGHIWYDGVLAGDAVQTAMQRMVVRMNRPNEKRRADSDKRYQQETPSDWG